MISVPKYADTTVVKERSSVGVKDLALTDRDGDGQPDEDDLDSLIDDLNERASSTIDAYCNRDFEDHAGFVETLDGNGRGSIRLTGYPVRSVSTVKVGGSTLSSDEYRVKSDSPAWVGENGGILERKGAAWPDGWENLEVTYDWGYTTPPPEIQQVASELVVEALRSAAANDKGAGGGAQSYSMDGFSVSFDDSLKSLVGLLDTGQREVLDKHRRVIIA